MLGDDPTLIEHCCSSFHPLLFSTAVFAIVIDVAVAQTGGGQYQKYYQKVDDVDVPFVVGLAGGGIFLISLVTCWIYREQIRRSCAQYPCCSCCKIAAVQKNSGAAAQSAFADAEKGSDQGEHGRPKDDNYAVHDGVQLQEQTGPWRQEAHNLSQQKNTEEGTRENEEDPVVGPA